MERTWFEEAFRRKPHPVLRLLGNLVLCAFQAVWVIGVTTHFHTAWRWLAVPFGLRAILSDTRGAVLAARDLRQSGSAPVPD
ncbi:hypothetical protein ACFYPN_22070 [Streptomyces sp. NPDC005576]|uniref:hypothetical protein n=1 Tax=Streptomyces sp. NPDC005576 TaxID=3364726 RepID=UPI0036B59E7D